MVDSPASCEGLSLLLGYPPQVERGCSDISCPSLRSEQNRADGAGLWLWVISDQCFEAQLGVAGIASKPLPAPWCLSPFSPLVSGFSILMGVHAISCHLPSIVSFCLINQLGVYALAWRKNKSPSGKGLLKGSLQTGAKSPQSGLTLLQNLLKPCRTPIVLPSFISFDFTRPNFPRPGSTFCFNSSSLCL